MLNLKSNTKQEPHIIIVNDDHDTCALLLNCFQHVNWHHQVKVLNDADTLFELLDAIPGPELLPTLIVLDDNSIHWRAETALKLLKRDQRYRHIPVVYYTASVTARMEKQLQSIGAQSCRNKPKTKDNMHLQVRELVELAKPHRLAQRSAIF